MSLLKSLRLTFVAALTPFTTSQPHIVSVQVLESPEGNYLVLVGDEHVATPGFTEAEQVLMELLTKAINAGKTEKEGSGEESDYESDYESDSEEAPNDKFAIIWERSPSTKIHYSASQLMLKDGELPGMVIIGQTLLDEAAKQGSNVTFYAADPRHTHAPFVFKTEADALNFAHCVLADLLAFEKRVQAFELPGKEEAPAQQLKNMIWKELFAQFSDMVKTVVRLIEDTANNTGPYSIEPPSMPIYDILFELNSDLANYSFLHHIINYNGPAMVYAGAAHLGNPEKESNFRQPNNVSIYFLKKENSLQPQQHLVLRGPAISRLAKTLIQSFGYTLLVNKNFDDSREETSKSPQESSEGLTETIEKVLNDYILYPQEEKKVPTVRQCRAFYALADGDMAACENLAQKLKTDRAEGLRHHKQRSEELALRDTTNREEIIKERLKIHAIVNQVKTLPRDKASPLLQRLLLLLFMAQAGIDLNSVLQSLPPETKKWLSSTISQSIQIGCWENNYQTIIPTLSREQLEIVSHKLSSFLEILHSTPSGVTTTTTTTTAITLPSSSGPIPSSSNTQPAQLVSSNDQETSPATPAPLPSAHAKHERDEEDRDQAPDAKRRRSSPEAD